VRYRSDGNQSQRGHQSVLGEGTDGLVLDVVQVDEGIRFAQ
jgi:hypothetical protein